MSDLSGVLSEEGMPGRFLVIAAAKLLVDGQDYVCLHVTATTRSFIHSSV